MVSKFDVLPLLVFICTSVQGVQRPNILVIVADDLGGKSCANDKSVHHLNVFR